MYNISNPYGGGKSLRSKTVTLADIAQELGVSKNAVSLALRGKDGVGKELRDKIIAKAQEMQYISPEKLQGCVLALIPQRFTNASNSLFYHQVCYEMEAYAAKLDCPLIISSVSEEDEKSCTPPLLLDSISCIGIITVGNLSKAYCRMIRGLNLRYVMADQYYEDLAVDSVTTANVSGTYLLTEHLIQNGHKRIQYFGTRFRTASLEDRWLGYKRALSAYHLPVLTNCYTEVQAANFDEMALITKALNECDEMPTAFVCGHDMTARSIIYALALRGLRYPNDFSVVGFDDIQSPELQELNLTTYSTPKAEIARVALDLMLNANRSTPQKIQLYGNVVYRGSVKDIR